MKLFKFKAITMVAVAMTAHAGGVSARYIQSDPVGLRGGRATYGYAYSNPLSWTDPYGLKPGDMFKTVNAAVIDAVRYARKLSASDRIERGGWIFKTGNGCYSYGEPIAPSQNDGPTRLRIPDPSPFDVEWWHTHTNEGPTPNKFSEVNWDGKGSPGDVGTSQSSMRPGNLGAPNGSYLKYVPGKGVSQFKPDDNDNACTCNWQ